MKKWVSRIVEGLLIGLGVILVMGAYNQIKSSTKALDGATKRILKQENINLQLNERIEVNSKNYVLSKMLLADELSKINTAIDELATHVEKIGEAEPAAIISPTDWSKLQSNSANQIKVPEVEWFKANADFKKPSTLKPFSVEWEHYNIDKSKYISQNPGLDEPAPFSLPQEEDQAFESLRGAIMKQSQIPLE